MTAPGDTAKEKDLEHGRSVISPLLLGRAWVHCFGNLETVNGVAAHDVIFFSFSFLIFFQFRTYFI